ncbi:unnamed protein product [Protopolystoma xenopodis]|uniref:Uncharacterized protein n=1 Tax=Protopolystoma xenopodis TaxID=117903 RepID=A0A3S5A0B6_9PLAT|nr:unnamed protein product [Protopolystoma xenopodis]
MRKSFLGCSNKWSPNNQAPVHTCDCLSVRISSSEHVYTLTELPVPSVSSGYREWSHVSLFERPTARSTVGMRAQTFDKTIGKKDMEFSVPVVYSSRHSFQPMLQIVWREAREQTETELVIGHVKRAAGTQPKRIQFKFYAQLMGFMLDVSASASWPQVTKATQGVLSIRSFRLCSLILFEKR